VTISTASVVANHVQSGTFENNYSRPASATLNNSRATLRAALYGGLVAAVLSTIPVGPTFIFAFPFAGFLSVIFYRRWSAGPEVRPGAAFKLGALTGVFGFVMFLVLTAIGTITFHAQNELREAMLQAIHQKQARAADPQARQMLEYFTTAQGMAVMMVAGFIFMGLVLVVLSGAGAALSASLLRRKGPPEG